jgi:hypothetical protein
LAQVAASGKHTAAARGLSRQWDRVAHRFDVAAGLAMAETANDVTAELAPR